jgi:branched-chain amino acid transport system ATP-binding protein/branched-chain amino acid transport system permease protein
MTAAQIRLVAAAAVLCLLAAPFWLNPFSITLLNYVGIYALAAIGLALLTGVGGIVSFGQAAFVGIAAYATAWVSALNGYSVWLGLLLAVALTCAVAAILGFVTLRLQGHFLSLSTVAWGLAIYFLFGNIEGLGNYNGISNIPPVAIGSLVLTESRQIYFLIWGIVVAALVLCHNLLDSRVGRAMRALRGGNTLVESLGISAFRIKLTTFVLAAFLGALSGWLYAHLSRFISPGPFDAGMGIEYLMMAMVGGAGSVLGGVVGAAIVTLLKNSVQDYLPLIAKGASGQLEVVAFSALFILFLQRARQGIVPFLAGFLPEPKQPLPQAADALPRRAQPAPGTLLLQVDGVERRFGGLVAVNNVSFEVRAGEILGLIGPNGAGKSTIFNLLTGALRANRGEIAFAGRSITRDPQCHIARAGVARTFQHVKLRPRMTLLDNVLLGTYARTRAGLLAGALRLNRAEEASARYAALRELQRVGLGDRPFELAGNLPLGNQRLLEIARALAADPALLVLDEPAAGLRRQEKLRLAELLRALRKDNLTILLVEHDMDFVMTLVDRIVVLDFGSKLCEGEPAAIRGDARVQEAYLGGVA